jgi:hypothetical protein
MAPARSHQSSISKAGGGPTASGWNVALSRRHGSGLGFAIPYP